MANNPNQQKNVNEPHKKHEHESGKGGSAQGAGDRGTQSRAQDGQMNYLGLDYEKQREIATERGEGGNKKSDNQSKTEQQRDTDSIKKEMD